MAATQISMRDLKLHGLEGAALRKELDGLHVNQALVEVYFEDKPRDCDESVQSTHREPV
jgi:hypothetical protein